MRNYKVSVLMSILLLLLTQSTVYAHRLLINPQEAGRLQVVFDDGTAAQSAEVVLYDDEGQELERGSVDSDGYYSYDTELPIARIEANDGLGHRVAWVYGTETETTEPILPRAFFATSGFIFAASFFNYRSTIRRRKQTPVVT